MMNHYKIRILLGFLLFIFILYNRFRHREERFLYTSFDFWKLSCYVIICCTMIFLCLKNLLTFYRWLKNLENPPTKNKIILFLKSVICICIKPINYVISNLEILDIYVKNNTPYYDTEKEQRYTDVIVQYVGNLLAKYNRISILLTLILIALCQSIVVLSFFADIFFYQKFNYFYKFLWIIIFPLIIQYIIYSIKIYVIANLQSFNENLHIHIMDNDTTNSLKKFETLPRITLEQHALILKVYKEQGHMLDISFIYTLSPELLKDPNINVINTIENSKPLVTMWCKLHFYIIDWENAKKNYLSLFNVIKYFLYSLCWFYLTYLLL